MAPDDFIDRWKKPGTERADAQMFFNELCDVLGVDRPQPSGCGNYCFEKRVNLGDKSGFADVYKEGYFVGEFKRPGSSIVDAFNQAHRYAVALDNPPILIVTDLRNIVIRSCWTRMRSKDIWASVDCLADPDKKEVLVWAMTEPERLLQFQTPQEALSAAARNYQPKAPGPSTVSREERKLVTDFLDRIYRHLYGLSVDGRSSIIPEKDYRALRVFGSRLTFNRDTHPERTDHPEFQRLQDAIVDELVILAGYLGNHYVAEVDYDRHTGNYVLKSQSHLPDIKSAKQRIMEQLAELRRVVDRSRTVYRT